MESIRSDRVQLAGNLLVIVLLWGGFLSVFFPEWRINEQYGYGLFVPFLCAYLLFLRSEDRPAPVSHFRVPALLVLVASLIALIPLHVVLGANPEWRLALWALAMVTLAATFAMIWLWGGWPWFRHFFSPMLLMLLAVPWPTFIENPMVLGLMGLVASGTVEVMNLIGLHAVQMGNLIKLSTGFVGVEEACSGVRSFQSTLMAAYFFGVLFRWPVIYRLLLIGVGCIVSLILNFGRTFTLTMVMATRGPEAMDVLHDLVGNVVSYGSYAVLFFLTWIFHRWVLKGGRIRQVQWGTGRRDPLPVHRSALAAAALLIVSSPMVTWLWYDVRSPIPAERIQSEVAWEEIPYQIREESIPPTVRNILRFSDGKQAIWTDRQRNQWTVFFFRWDPGTVSSHVTVHRPEVCLPSAGFQLERKSAEWRYELDKVVIDFNAYVFRVADHRYHVFFAVWDSVPGYSVPLGSGWRDRLRHAWQGRRVEGRYSLQLVLTGPRLDEQSAEHRVREFLDKALSSSVDSG